MFPFFKFRFHTYAGVPTLQLAPQVTWANRCAEDGKTEKNRSTEIGPAV